MEPQIRINWSESNHVHEGIFTVAQARSMMHTARFHAPVGGGYDKVNFTLVIGGGDVFTGRCDVEHIDNPGDGDADPIEHTRRWARWVLSEKGQAFHAQHKQEWPGDFAVDLLGKIEAL